jgi:8-oxo-dGTP pyrophosphatase MutT (NUDIX family)
MVCCAAAVSRPTTQVFSPGLTGVFLINAPLIFFAAAALRAADGAYLVGEMAPYTACARQLYFPCGTPEPSDILIDGTLDLQANLRRELLEETGIDIDELDTEPGWTVVLDGAVVAIMKKLTAHQDASELRARIFQHLATEAQPELSDIWPVRALSDLDDRCRVSCARFSEIFGAREFFASSIAAVE